jgi:hypothetical protein
MKREGCCGKTFAITFMLLKMTSMHLVLPTPGRGKFNLLSLSMLMSRDAKADWLSVLQECGGR